MTLKAMKLMLSKQAKATSWFIGTYTLIIAILLIVFSYVKIDDISWIPESNIYAPKIYLLVMGILYPLISTKLYVSQGLTRKQFFWAYTGTISITSLFLLIPILTSVIYFDSLSLLSVIKHYLHMPLFFLIGWTSVVGFQLSKWYTSILGIICAVAMFHFITTVPEILALPELAVLGSAFLLLLALLLILPRFISQIQLKI